MSIPKTRRSVARRQPGTGSWRARAAGAGATLALLAGTVPAAFAPASAAPADGPAGELLDLTQYVDPHIGTAVSETSGYAGNVSPGAKVPFGMVTFGPDMSRTNYNGSGGYLLAPEKASGEINFFSLTHLNGPGCPGQGVVGMLPRTDATSVTDAAGVPQEPATFQTANESAAPGAYSVRLDSGVEVELGATTRTGIATFTYPDADAAYFSLDTRLNANSNMARDAGMIEAENVALEVSEDGSVLSGKTVAPAFCTPWGTPYNSNVYFYAEFDRTLEPQDPGADSPVNTVVDGSTVLQYDVPADDPSLTMRVGISSVSVENAQENLAAEAPTAGLDEVRAAADDLWNERLNTVQVDRAADPDSLTEEQRAQLVKFYTSLYRVFGSPTVYSDTNGDFRSMEATELLDGQPDRAGYVQERETVNVSDYDYTKPNGETGGYDTHYSSLSFWDSYRSQAQMLALLAPDVASDVAQSTIVDGLQCGALPHWVDASDDSTPMSGDNALPVIAGTYAFGARDFDLTAAARLVQQSSFDPTSACNGNASFAGMEQYLEDGYYPEGDWTSANIERYNSDYAAAEFLAAVSDAVQNDVPVTDEQIDALYDRAGWWTTILDPETKTLRSRVAPTEPGVPGEFGEGTFHESTEPNYFWSFAHAWDGLIEGIGGNEAAVERLNALFSMDDELTNEPTLRQLNGGQDAETFYMGNEPSYQGPFAYNWAGKPAGTQYVVSQLRDTAFGTDRDGMPGNDDLGAQSSWYVFASLGIFPIVPSEAGLAITSPMFPAATVWLDGEPVRITTDGDPAAEPFIESMSVDGHSYGRSWMTAETLTGASEISFGLSSTPTEWAADVHPTDAAATTTSLELSPTSQEAGADVTAHVAVASADETLPRGTIEIRLDGTVVAEAGIADDSIDVPFTVPAETEPATLQVTAAFVPADPSFLEPSVSDAAPLEVTERAVEPTPEPTDPGTDEPTQEPTGDAGDDGSDEGSDDAAGTSDSGDSADGSQEPGDAEPLPDTGIAVTAWIVAAVLLAAGGLVLRRRQSA